MAIDLETFSLVLRRDRLQAVLPGGWAQYLAEYGPPPARQLDDDLLGLAAATAPEARALVAHWRRRGLALAQGAHGAPDSGDMALLQAAPAGAPAEGCGWLAVADDNRACFIGARQDPRRARFASPWSGRLVRLSRDAIADLLATPAALRAPLPLKNWNDRFALLRIDPQARACLVATDRETGARQRYAQVADLLDAGWAVD